MTARAAAVALAPAAALGTVAGGEGVRVVPAALLIDFDYPPWHTADDTLDKVSARSLGIVGDVLLDALPAVERSLSRTSGGRSP